MPGNTSPTTLASAPPSHLSGPRFGYDLVVATTQDAINATMDQFLHGYNGREITACYLWDAARQQVVAGDLATITTAAGVDPFTIPDGSDQATAAVGALREARFAFAFRARLGLPPGVPLHRLPAVVQLDKGSASAVTYQLFFAEFTVLKLDAQGQDLSWTSITQPPGTPWVFAFDVDLGTRSGDASAFSNLPPAVQQKVASLGATAFSVQQLYLNLNTPGLQSSAAIPGLDPASAASTTLHQVFLDTYWDTLKGPDGAAEVPLGYTVQPAGPEVPTASLQPTAIALDVSPYRDADGRPTQDFPLYTLDYRAVSGRDLPPAVAFPWNWVEPVADGGTNPSGVLAVSRTAFARYLSELLSPALSEVCWAPMVELTVTSSVFSEFEAALTMSPAPVHETYQPVTDPGDPAKVLAFAFSAQAADGCNPLVESYTLDVRTTVTSGIWFRDTQIVISSTFTMHARSTGSFEDTKEGDFYKTRLDSAYTLGVSDGRLVVTLDGGRPDPVNLATDVPSQNFLEGWFGSASGGLIQHATTFFGDTSRYLAHLESSVTEALNGSAGWVFPGGHTFAFKDARFSAYQDLVTRLTYRDIAPTTVAAS